MDTFLQALFERLMSFAATSLDNCSMNTHYQPDLRHLKKISINTEEKSCFWQNICMGGKADIAKSLHISECIKIP